MKKNQKLYQILLLAITVLFLSGTVKIRAEAKTAGVLIDTKTSMISVTYKGSSISTTAYKKETVYAYTDITFVRRGPGKSYSKVKSIKFDMGKKLTRIGNIKNKWSIILVNGKRYFVGNSLISKDKPEKKLSVKKYTPRQFKRKGVIRWNGWRWTWYSQRVLRGSGLRIPGRHVDTKGYVCDEDGYICLASSRLRKGSIVKTPFGKKGKVYDSGCSRGTLDVYTNF